MKVNPTVLVLIAVTAIQHCLIAPAHTKETPRSAASPEAQAEGTLKAMTPDEKVILTYGIMPLPFGNDPPPVPEDAISGAGYVHGIPRLNIPSLKETDASLGVAFVSGQRNDWATALPSAVAMASTWNPELIRAGGAMIGSEARAKGFNVMLAGGVNLMRDPRNGRTFEYFSEDPLLSGILAGNAISGIQSNHIISTIKHLALNGQETGRQFADVKISDAAARESDLLAFQIGIEIGNPGAVMCSYNLVNGRKACDSDYLLNKVLKGDWHYKGFVMSDWGAVPNLGTALNGLDQQSGAQLDSTIFFKAPLEAAAKGDRRFAARLDDMNRRVLWAIYANGVDKNPATPGGKIDFVANAAVAEETARQGIVLLRNERGALPLTRAARRILVIGGYANGGVMSGAGSSQVQGEGGPSVLVPMGAKDMPFANFLSQQYHNSVPLNAIRKAAPAATVTYRDGTYITEAVTQAKRADVVIVFATKWSSEGLDQPDLSLPNGQDALIAAVGTANPNTVVVLETGNPVLMPWLDRTAAVLQAWYPGARGAEAIASVLFGDTNPSGRLPVTFPASEADLPRPKVDGFDWIEPSFIGAAQTPDAKLPVDYDIEGSDLGYRWNARKGHSALFPFGYGLSFTRFESSGLSINDKTGSFTVKNIGDRAGATVAQLYMIATPRGKQQRLVAFQRIELNPGESRRIVLPIEQRIVAEYEGDGWVIAPGTYTFALGEDAQRLGAPISISLGSKRIRP